MKILQLCISYPPNIGGVETHLHDLTRWLGQKKDLEVDVLTYQPITTPVVALDRENEGSVRIYRIPWFGTHLFHQLESKPIFQFLYLAPRLFFGLFQHLITQGPYDVIHAHGLISIWAAGVAKWIWQTPVLGSIHAVYEFPPDSWTARRMASVYGMADSILTLSDASLIQWQSIGIPENQLGRFNYWVDLNLFTPCSVQDARKDHHLPISGRMALFVGRLLPRKGLGIIFQLVERHPDILFVIAGDGPLESECRKQSVAHANIVFLGAITNAKLPSLYASADVLLIPSLYEEGYGRVACESLACGTPVVASNRGGLKEAVPESCGRLVEPTVQHFSHALVNILADDSSVIRARCRQEAESRFGWIHAQKIEERLRTLSTHSNHLTP